MRLIVVSVIASFSVPALAQQSAEKHSLRECIARYYDDTGTLQKEVAANIREAMALERQLEETRKQIETLRRELDEARKAAPSPPVAPP